jgi:hypothetical protein
VSDFKPWLTEEGKSIWKTEAQYWQWLRGALRRLWSDYPLRKQWKANQLRPVTQQERDDKMFHTSTKKVGECSLCNNWFPGSKLECDHLQSSNGCTSKETAEQFLWHCGGLTGDMFQLVCKPCHKIKSYAERQGISYEEAVIKKKVIAFMKNSTEDQFDFLSKYASESDVLRTRKDREKFFTKLLEEDKIE